TLKTSRFFAAAARGLRSRTVAASSSRRLSDVAPLLFLFLRFMGGDDLGLHVRRHDVVAAGVHEIAALSAGDALELRRVRRPYGQRHFRRDNRLITGQNVLPGDLSAAAGEVAGDLADEIGGSRHFKINDWF